MATALPAAGSLVPVGAASTPVEELVVDWNPEVASVPKLVKLPLIGPVDTNPCEPSP